MVAILISGLLGLDVRVDRIRHRLTVPRASCWQVIAARSLSCPEEPKYQPFNHARQNQRARHPVQLSITCAGRVSW